MYDAGVAVARCTPRLGVFAETLYIGDDEVTTAMLGLDFTHVAGARDRAAELQAARVLESLGAIELAQLDDCAVSPGARVDYLVALDGDVHALCAFSAYAIPQLKNLGWHVTIAPD